MSAPTLSYDAFLREKVNFDRSVPRVCALESCGKPLTQREREDNYAFRHRKFCSRPCSGVGSRRPSTIRAVRRVCARPGCGQPVTKVRAVTCSRRCMGAVMSAKRVAARPEPESKVCALDGCDTVFARDIANVGPKDWARRRFCTSAHAAVFRRKPVVVKTAKVVKPKAVRKPPPVAAPSPVVAPLPVKSLPRAIWRPEAYGWPSRPGDERYVDEPPEIMPAGMPAVAS